MNSPNGALRLFLVFRVTDEAAVKCCAGKSISLEPQWSVQVHSAGAEANLVW